MDAPYSSKRWKRYLGYYLVAGPICAMVTFLRTPSHPSGGLTVGDLAAVGIQLPFIVLGVFLIIRNPKAGEAPRLPAMSAGRAGVGWSRILVAAGLFLLALLLYQVFVMG